MTFYSNIFKVFCKKKRIKTTIFVRFSAKTIKNINIYKVSAIIISFSAKSMQKHHYLLCVLRKTLKNTNIYQVFCKTHAKITVFTRFSATRMQKQQYLQGFLQQAFKNTNIYQVFCNAHAIFMRFLRPQKPSSPSI